MLNGFDVGNKKGTKKERDGENSINTNMSNSSVNGARNCRKHRIAENT